MQLKEVKHINHKGNFQNFRNKYQAYRGIFTGQIKPVGEKIEDLYVRFAINNSTEFKKHTQLDTYQYNRLKQPNNKPSLATLVSLVYGLQLDSCVLNLLCDSLGVKVNLIDPVACAYTFILDYYKGYDIVDANKLLLILWVEEKDLLGSPEARAIAVEELKTDMPEVYKTIKH